MSRGIFRQADMERIIRAAKRTGSIVQVDLRSLIVTVLPGAADGQALSPLEPTYDMALDGEENWEWENLTPSERRARRKKRED